MKLSIYAMRDQRTGYLQPTFEQNDASAVRNFEHALMNTDSLINSHTEDFSVYRLGEYDTCTGVIKPEKSPVLVLDGKSFA